MTYYDAVKSTAKQILCDAVLFWDALAGSALNLFNETPGAAAVHAFKNYATPLLCDRPPPPPDRPFPGGQCEKAYLISMQIFERHSGNQTRNTTSTRGVWGPISAFQYRTDPLFPVPNTFWVLCRGFFLADGSPPSPTPIWLQLNRSIYGENLLNEYVVTPTITTLDGSPDNCGDPPPEPSDPDGPWRKGDTIINWTNNNVNFTLPVSFTIGFFFLDANLNLNIPVTFNVNPNFSFNPNFNFNFDATFNFGTGDWTVSPPYPDGDGPPRQLPPPQYNDPPTNVPPGLDTDPPPLPPDPPEPPPSDPPKTNEPKLAILGALVTVTNADNVKTAGSLDQDRNPNVYFPDLGLISFSVRVKNSWGWTEDIRIKNVRQFIPCPWPGGAVDVRGTAREGASITVTPVYGVPDERFNV